MPPELIASCAWTPAVIVDLLKALAWPVTVLLLGLRFRKSLTDGARRFFANRSLAEVSAGTAGISAKFEPDRQVAHSAGTGTARAATLPEAVTLETIKRNHESYQTPFSDDLYQAVKTHIAALPLSNEEAIDLLAKDNSLLQAALRFYELNRSIFRSQYDLLSGPMGSELAVSLEVIRQYFKGLQVREPLFTNWDVVKYLAFLTESRLIEETNGAYKITKFGSSYLAFMRKNLQLVEGLSKL